LQFLIDGDDMYILVRAFRSNHTTVLMDLVLLHSVDGGETWDREYIVSDGRAGSYPSMAMDPGGQLAVSYYQCGDVYEPQCNAEHDGLMLAVRESSGWAIGTVQNDPAMLDGMFSAIAFAGDKPVLAARTATMIGPFGGAALKVFFGTPASEE
jgi:hypothetical protein